MSFIPAQFNTQAVHLPDEIPSPQSWFQLVKNDLRSPKEFFNPSCFVKPTSNPFTLRSRISNNVSYFKANYSIVVGLVLVYYLLTNFHLLLAIVILGGGFYGVSKLGEETTVAGVTIHRNQVYLATGVIGLPLLIMSGPIATLVGGFFWIALLLGPHAVCYERGVTAEQDLV